MNGKPWSKAELDMLSTLSGELPLRLLIAEYNKWARRNGYPKRTSGSIRSKSNRVGYDLKATGEYLTARAASLLLGCKSDVVSYWVKLGRLPCVRYSDSRNSFVWVKRSDIRALAKRKPEYFNGFSYKGLMFLLEDDALVERITSTRWSRSYGRARPVVMLSTGKVFPSMKEAARQVGVGPTTLRDSVYRGWTCAGSKWKLARTN